MRKPSVLIPIVLDVLLAATLQAQNAGPSISSDMKEAYNQIKINLIKAAEKMPEENYSFQPTKEVRSFGAWIAHVSDVQVRGCSRIAGLQKDINAASKTAKADLVAALKESFAACDAVYDGLTDANAADLVPSARGQRLRLTLLATNVAHDNECYGSIAVYMRLKGLVPPSSEASSRMRQNR